MMRNSIFLAIVCVVLCACSSKQYTITGNIGELTGKKMYLVVP